MRALLIVALAIATPAWAQIRAVEGMTAEQKADYRKLLFGYRDTFRALGRAQVCRLDIDPAPFFREIAFRHGEGSEPALIAQMSYAAGKDNVLLSRELDPKPPAPIPCDVLQYMRNMWLPDVPASLRP